MDNQTLLNELDLLFEKVNIILYNLAHNNVEVELDIDNMWRIGDKVTLHFISYEAYEKKVLK